MSEGTYTLSTGTPNEQADIKTGTLAEVGRKAIRVLGPMTAEAEKFTPETRDQIRSITEELRQVRHAHSLKVDVGGARSWRLDYMGVTFVITIRRIT